MNRIQDIQYIKGEAAVGEAIVNDTSNGELMRVQSLKGEQKVP